MQLRKIKKDKITALLVILALVSLTGSSLFISHVTQAASVTEHQRVVRNQADQVRIRQSVASSAAATSMKTATQVIAAGKSVSATSSTSAKTNSSLATVTSKNAATAALASYSPVATVSPRGLSLYVNPSLAQQGRPIEIASQPTATWLGGWTNDVSATANTLVSAASTQNSLAVLVTYNIPGRDCGSYSAGGLSSSDAYKAWIRSLASGIGHRKAIVILEPDALGQIDCLSPADQISRYGLLADAVTVLTTQTNAFVYIDAGNSSWIDASTMTTRLVKANVAQARGFSLNVSNFYTTASNTTYGNQIAAVIGKSFVIDTGRNGKGSNGEWCNPTGRGLGVSPTTSVSGNVDAYLWVKVPGESDGSCNGGPSNGAWWNDYALGLIANRQ